MGTASPPTVAREAGTSRPALRRTRRRISAPHALIVLVVVLAFSLNYLALQDRGETARVAVADRPLTAGSVVAASDLRFVPIDADFDAIDSLIVQSAAPSYEGWVVRRNVAEGELMKPAMLIAPGAPSGLRSMSIPVAIEHAAGGTLSAGDRIDVITVDDGVADYVVVDVEVLEVSESGGSLGSLGGYHLVVAVDAQEALALAAAIDAGSVEVIRSTGAEPSSVSGPGDDA